MSPNRILFPFFPSGSSGLERIKRYFQNFPRTGLMVVTCAKSYGLRPFLLCALLLPLCGCLHPLALHYDLRNIPVSTESGLKDKTISISPFGDVHGRDEEAMQFLWPENSLVRLDGEDTCINARRGYVKQDRDLGRAVARMITEHFDKRGAFESVYIDSATTADFSLSGTLEKFSGRQRYPATLAGISEVPVIGLFAATQRAKGSNTKIDIKLTGLSLRDRNGKILKALDDVTLSYQGNTPWDTHCRYIYVYMNDFLKIAIQKLATETEAAASSLTSSNGNKSQ